MINYKNKINFCNNKNIFKKIIYNYFYFIFVFNTEKKLKFI